MRVGNINKLVEHKEVFSTIVEENGCIESECGMVRHTPEWYDPILLNHTQCCKQILVQLKKLN